LRAKGGDGHGMQQIRCNHVCWQSKEMLLIESPPCARTRIIAADWAVAATTYAEQNRPIEGCARSVAIVVESACRCLKAFTDDKSDAVVVEGYVDTESEYEGRNFVVAWELQRHDRFQIAANQVEGVLIKGAFLQARPNSTFGTPRLVVKLHQSLGVTGEVLALSLGDNACGAQELTVERVEAVVAAHKPKQIIG
jgi:hypothetical protein